MNRTISEWGEYVTEQGLYGLRGDNTQIGGNLQQDSSIPALYNLDHQVKNDLNDFTGYIADPLVVSTNRVTTEEIEKEEDQGFIDSILGRNPETYIEHEERKEGVWATAQERDFFNDYDLDGMEMVCYIHLPFTVGGSDIRSRGGNDPKYERMDIILPGHVNSSQIERDLRTELEREGDLNRFAEGLADADPSLDTVYEVTRSGGQFAPEGIENIKDPRLILQENDDEFVTRYNESYEEKGLEIPDAVRILNEK